MERGIYSLIHVPKPIYLPANIGILFEKKKEVLLFLQIMQKNDEISAKSIIFAPCY